MAGRLAEIVGEEEKSVSALDEGAKGLLKCESERGLAKRNAVSSVGKTTAQLSLLPTATSSGLPSFAVRREALT